MALINLPPPPKFATEGPQNQDDWVVFYRWIQAIYQVLLIAYGNGQQSITFGAPVSINIAMLGQLQQLEGLVLSAYSRSLTASQKSNTAYVADALPNPWFIPATVHGQGNLFSVQCWSGPVVAGGPTGTLIVAEVDLDLTGTGDVTITYANGLVGSVVIQG